MTDAPVLSPHVAVLGAAAMDWVARVKTLPRRDEIVYADEYTPMTGGTGGNVAVGVARLGHGVRFLGMLGGDEGGQLLWQDFEAAGVDTRAIRVDPDQRSAACFIAIDGHGERVIFSLGGAALYDKAEDIDPAWLADVQMLYIADAYKEVATAAMGALKAEAAVVFNPGGLMASSGEAYLEPFFRRADVLIASRSEAETMSGVPGAEPAAVALARRGPGVVLVTLGGEGVLVLDQGQVTHVAAVPVGRVIDTTGAGDAFSSGVIAGMLEGLEPVEASRLGVAVAAIKIGHFGARGGLPDRSQVQAFVSQMNSKTIHGEVIS